MDLNRKSYPRRQSRSSSRGAVRSGNQTRKKGDLRMVVSRVASDVIAKIISEVVTYWLRS